MRKKYNTIGKVFSLPLTNLKTCYMKKLQLFTAPVLLLLLTTLSSCEAIKGIFKAGMGFGIFLVLAVIGIIVFIAMKAGGKKS